MTGRGLASERRLSEVAVCGAVLTWMFVACVFPVSDYDFWWHLRTGQLILEQGEVPRTDWFTYTDADRPWIDLHWGFQVGLAWLHALGGTAAVVVVKAALLTTAVGVGWFAAGRGLPGWVRAVIWAPSLIAIYGRAYERPEVISLVLLALWLWVTTDLERRGRWVWILPVAQVFWGNCHSLFALGAVVGVAAAADGVTRHWARGRWGCAAAEGGPGLKIWLGVAGLVALAAFFNPYGYRGAFFPWVVYRKFTVEQAFYAARIGEFQRPWDFLREHGVASVTLAAELAALALGVISFVALATRRRWSPLRVLLFVAFTHLAWEAARNTNLFCLVSAVLTCANWADWRRCGKLAAEGLSGNANAATSDAANAVPPEQISGLTRWHGWANACMCGLLVIGTVSVFTGAWGRWTGGTKAFGWGERENWFAHDAMRFAGREGMPKQAFVAHFGQAAVYSYHGGPDRRVFLDGRLEVCSQMTFEQWEWILSSIATGDRRWESSHRRQYGALPVIILDKIDSRPFIHAMRQTPGWRDVYEDATAVVFVDDQTADRLRGEVRPKDGRTP